MESDRVTTKLIQGDCLKIMPALEPKSIDLVLCDLPYGTTENKWDSIIPFEPLWECYNSILKKQGAVVLNSMQPFTTKLIASNLKHFKYCLYWEKNNATGFLNAKKQPLRNVEDICVFYDRQCTYNPIMTKSDKAIQRGKTGRQSSNYGKYHTISRYQTYYYYPRMLIKFNKQERAVHPTQKPIPLLEYLIKTYSNEGDTVLDNCMGSGSTGVAAVNTGRNFIGIEKEENYFKIAQNRIAQAEMLYEAALFHCD